jgi:hypothetical protein
LVEHRENTISDLRYQLDLDYDEAVDVFNALPLRRRYQGFTKALSDLVAQAMAQGAEQGDLNDILHDFDAFDV